VIYLLDKLGLKEIYCLDYSINKIKELVEKLKTLFLKARFHEKESATSISLSFLILDKGE
jgi:hypothetical protein